MAGMCAGKALVFSSANPLRQTAPLVVNDPNNLYVLFNKSFYSYASGKAKGTAKGKVTSTEATYS
jgi:hypothetical protein